MGKIQKIYQEALIDPTPDRNSNLLRVYEKDNGEVIIHFRNFKINLIGDQRAEWKYGFTEALRELQENNYLENDI